MEAILDVGESRIGKSEIDLGRVGFGGRDLQSRLEGDLTNYSFDA